MIYMTLYLLQSFISSSTTFSWHFVYSTTLWLLLLSKSILTFIFFFFCLFALLFSLLSQTILTCRLLTNLPTHLPFVPLPFYFKTSIFPLSPLPYWARSLFFLASTPPSFPSSFPSNASSRFVLQLCQHSLSGSISFSGSPISCLPSNFTWCGAQGMASCRHLTAHSSLLIQSSLNILHLFVKFIHSLFNLPAQAGYSPVSQAACFFPIPSRKTLAGKSHDPLLPPHPLSIPLLLPLLPLLFSPHP